MGKDLKKSLTVLGKVESAEDSIHKAIARVLLEIIAYHKKYYEKLPKRCIIYRSNVGARDLNSFIKEEIDSIVKGLEKEY